MIQQQPKPPRTLGIALAIMLSTLFYTVLPLVFVGFTYSLKHRMQSSGIMIGSGDVEIPGGSVGFMSITNVELGLWAGFALIFMFIAILAWRGGHTRIRYLFVATVVLVPLAYGALWGYRGYTDAKYLAESGAILPGAGLPGICSSVVSLPILLTLYTVWYMNRGPARAFYRGHYLSREDNTPNEKSSPV